VRPLVLSEPLSDGVVALRHWRDDDVPAIVAACQDPEIPRWTHVPVPYTEEDARSYLMALPTAMAAGERCSFALVAGGDEPVGNVGFPRVSWPDERAEVGYWLAAHARGRGLVTRAVRLISAWGLHEVGFHRIELMASTENGASLRVAERVGFTREGVLRGYALASGVRRDIVMFSRLASDVVRNVKGRGGASA
jgi:ribosomal-protein-alanine N-acetyltransferase